MARAMGIDAFITPEEGRTLAEQSADALGSAPDIVFECAGVPGSLDQAVSAVRRKGTVASPGFCWAPDTFTPIMGKIGRGSCRERVCQYVSMSWVAVALNKKTKNTRSRQDSNVNN